MIQSDVISKPMQPLIKKKILNASLNNCKKIKFYFSDNEGNVLFDDTLNTFYFSYMVLDIW